MGNVNSVRKVKAPELPLILEAARDGHRDKVRVFLRHEHDVNATCRFGVTPLMASALNGHYDVTQLLLKKGWFFLALFVLFAYWTAFRVVSMREYFEYFLNVIRRGCHGFTYRSHGLQ